MKKGICSLSHEYRIVAPISSYDFTGIIEVDIHNSCFRNSRYFVFRRVSSSRNPNHGKCYFRYNGDTYYFLILEGGENVNPLAYNLIEVLLSSHCERLTDKVFKRDPCPVKLRQELLAYEFALEEFQKFCKED